MNRREFLGAAALAATATAIGKDGEGSSAPQNPVNTFPVLNGPEFKGMEGAFVPIFTPYTKDDKVNGDMVGKTVERLLKAGRASTWAAAPASTCCSRSRSASTSRRPRSAP